MRGRTLLLITLVTVSLSACAARHGKVVIDPQGVDMGRYQTDLAQCRELSMQVDSKAGKGLVGGAVVGAVAGDIVGDSDTTRKGAKLGALGGSARGAAATKAERTMVVKNCLRNRGYTVLN